MVRGLSHNLANTRVERVFLTLPRKKMVVIRRCYSNIFESNKFASWYIRVENSTSFKKEHICESK